MLPPAKQQPCARSMAVGQPVGDKARCLWMAVNQAVLAERNQSVAPVGVWVESAQAGGRWEESIAFASAFQVEEELKEQQKEKEENLKRFQGEVKQRVNQQIKMRRKQQLQKSCEAAEKESSVVMRCSDSALHLTPKKNTCVYRSNAASTICSSGTNLIPVQQLHASWEEEGREKQSQLFYQQANTLSKTMKQVRRRLASCKTMPKGAGPPELPGGIWSVSPSRNKPVSRRPTPVHGEECEEFPLAGHHDLPAELQNQATTKNQAEQGDDNLYYKLEFGKFLQCHFQVLLYIAPRHLPLKTMSSFLQRQNQYLRYRRLFMDIEREQVKEQQRQKERQKKIAKIKSEKEHQRRAEEQRIQEMAYQQDTCSGEKACEILAQLRLEERRVRKSKEKQQRNKEYMRYMDALRAQMREKIKLYNIDLPPLCCCGSDFWDSHPDTCANNCVFYKNHKAYARALQSVISSCDISDGNSTTRLAIHNLASVHAPSVKNP
ncbi:pyruvate dehyrogenase phosphatase catalytic subunit 1 [Platysternon megacephalum]|uniref:Pyruvate dehyrogenase phosphatase catalytic subunit 1 n=1 Tax=Platysternon megacephalum TaxID=55544 RepID=A0A4D9E7T8_9SAUR|nr:pyruvate dehyrogenase phosphatase catalytic subunit 1 [Platysternon megacephalum]